MKTKTGHILNVEVGTTGGNKRFLREWVEFDGCTIHFHIDCFPIYSYMHYS